MPSSSPFLLFTALLLPAVAYGQTPGPRAGELTAPTATAAAPAVPAILAELAWLAGGWRAEGPDGTLNETVIMAPGAGVMTGAMRLSAGDRLLVQELFAFVETERGVELRLRHFGRGLEAQEEAPIVLSLTDVTDGHAVFEGPWAGGSLTSSVRRTGPDSWTGRTQIVGADGETNVMENHFVRGALESSAGLPRPERGAIARHGGEGAPASPEVTNTSYVASDGSRVQQLEVVVPATPEEVWAAFTTTEGFSSWAVPVAWVDFEVGGIMETSYDPGARRGDPENIKNRILSYLPMRMIAIQAVQAPSDFPHPDLLDELFTVIEIEALTPGRVRVRASGVGYGEGEGWDTLYRFFERGNTWTLEQLHRRFTDGPTDWSGTAPPGEDL